MDEDTRCVITAALGVLASVNPETIIRNRRGEARTGVDGHALANLAEQMQGVFPEALAAARANATCSKCGREPWQTYHAGDCPRRDHVLYDSDGRPSQPHRSTRR